MAWSEEEMSLLGFSRGADKYFWHSCLPGEEGRSKISLRSEV
jgi:hypothetical protein